MPAPSWSWHGYTETRFVALGRRLEAQRLADGWYARCDRRIAGPFGTGAAARARAEAMLAEAERSAAA